MAKDSSIIANKYNARIYYENKTKHLLRFLPQGSIALLNHQDIDEVAAQGLIEKKVVAVLNYAPSLSGKYVCHGTQLLIEHHIPVFDVLDTDTVKQTLRQGDHVNIVDQQLWVVKKGIPHLLSPLKLYTPQLIENRQRLAQQCDTDNLEKFIQNSLLFAQKELSDILQPVSMPPLTVDMNDQPVVVVTRGRKYMEELRALHDYIHHCHPILIGVDGGADAILNCGFSPHIIIGDMDSVSEKALKSGAEIVVHAYKDGTAPGMDRVHLQHRHPQIFSCVGTSEDAAYLLANEAGANLIVSVGSHKHMVDFLEKGRAGMGSTLLVRLKLGEKIVDASHFQRLQEAHEQLSYDRPTTVYGVK